MMRKNLILFILFFSTISAFTQSAINGVVLNEKNNPLPGASVVIDNTFLGISTNLDGSFSFTGLESTEYLLKVSFIGYNTFEKVINPGIDKETIKIKMTPSAILTDEVIVSATRAGQKTPVAYTDITKEDIKSNNTGQDIPYLLSATPSLVSTSDAGAGIGYTNFRIRGTDANRINITVNGIPLNDAESHGVYWVNMPDFASSIENIQVQRGVGTSTNGAGAFGATVNMQTNNLKKDAYAEWNGAAGSFNTFKNTVSVGSGLLNGKFTFDARLSKIHSDGYIDRAESDLKSFFVSGGYYAENTILKLNIFSGKEKTYQAWYGVPSELLEDNRTYNMAGEYTDIYGNTSYYDNQTDNYQQDHYQLLFSQKISSNLNLNAALHYTYGRGYYEEYSPEQALADYNMTPIIINDSVLSVTDLIRQKWLDNDFYGGTFSLNYNLTKTKLTLGGAWNRYDGRHFGNVIWAQFYGLNDLNHEWYRSISKKTDYNIFGKINYDLSESFNAYLDMQYRHIDYDMDGIDNDLRDITQSHKFNFINPKFGLLFNPSNRHKFNLLYAIGNREPNRSNYTDTDPNGPKPKPEKLHDFELGYDYQSSNFTAGANLYFMYYKDQLVLTGEINDVGSAIMTNTKKSYRSGIELMAGWKILPTLSWDVNATFSKNKILDFTEYVDDWDTWSQIETNLGTTDIAFSPNIIANSNLSWEPIKNFQATLISQYVGKQFIDNSSSDERKLNGYFINNLALNYSFNSKFFEEISLSLRVNNLLDVEYESNAWVYSYYTGNKRYKMDGYYPQAGINFMVGINIRF